ncbi:jg13392, partial [Pararge aegeria aegeria]
RQGGTGQRGSGKGRGGSSTLPYVIPCTSTDTGQTSDSSDGNCEDKRAHESSKLIQYLGNVAVAETHIVKILFDNCITSYFLCSTAALSTSLEQWAGYN